MDCTPYFFLILTLLGISIGSVNGQDLYNFNQLSLQMGASHNRFIDEAYTNNRLKYAGTNFLISSSWEKLAGKNYWSLSFEGSKGRVINSTADLDANLIYGQLAARYGKPILRSLFRDSTQQTIAAIQLNSTNCMIEDILDDTWYTGNVTLSSNHTLSLAFRYSGWLNKKNKLMATVVLPFAGWTKRTNYEDGVNQKAEKAWLEGKTFDLLFKGSRFKFYLPWELLDFRVIYSRLLGSSTQWIVSYQFRYMNNRETQPISLYANSLTTGFSFNLGKKK